MGERRGIRQRQISIDNRELLIAASDGNVDNVNRLIEAGADVNFVDRDGNTALHYAVESCSLVAIRLLVRAVKDVNIKNNVNETPLDIAKRIKRRDIVQILQQATSQCQQNSTTGKRKHNIETEISEIPHPSHQFSQTSEQSRDERNKVNERLLFFVNAFVEECEGKLKNYWDEVAGKIRKSCKLSSPIEAVGTGLGSVIGTPLGAPGLGGTAGGKVAGLFTSFVGERVHKDRAARIIEVLFTLEKPILRTMLVDVGVEIFQCFESQFMKANVVGGWKVAMGELAQNAMERIMNYIDDYKQKHRKIELPSQNFIAKGFILGKSKGYVGTLIPKRSIKNQQKEWKIAELCEEVGLVKTKSDGSGDIYYKNCGTCSTATYGHRLLFKWESENQLALEIKLNSDYCEEKPPREEYKYTLKPEETKEKSKMILDVINKKDPILKLNRIEEGVQKGTEEIRILQLRQEKSKAILEKSQQVLGRVEKKQDDVKQDIGEIKKGVQNLLGKHERKDKKTVWFNIRDSVTSFTGRQKQLDQISTSIQQRMVIISGLGGVGKSELAINYAHRQERQQVSVIWINAETRDTAKDSFRRLALEKLKIKIKDAYGEERSINSLIEEVYRYFSDTKCLYIFDNAEKYNNFEEFLPKIGSYTNKPYILVTSRNRQLFNRQEYKNIERLHLGVFSEIESRFLIKQTLEIDNMSQDQDIDKLGSTLGHLPLALQHATAYIKKSSFTISNYVKIYEKSEEEVKSLLSHSGLNSYHKTIFSTFQIAVNQIEQSEDEESELSREILDIMVYLASDSIPKETFLKLEFNGIQDNDVEIKTIRATGQVNRAVQLLEQYSIIHLDLERTQLNIHRLVQQVIRLELRNLNKEENTIEKALRLLKNNIVDRQKAESYLPHVISLWNHASKYDTLIRSFIGNDTNIETNYTTYLHLIAKGSSYEVVLAILNELQQSNNDQIIQIVNAKDKDRGTPLHNAVFNGNLQIVQCLIEKGANVNSRKRKNGWTPLHLASMNGQLEIVKALLEKEASIFEETEYKYSSLHLAARNGHLEIVKYLLNKGAYVNAVDKHEYTPLHFAVKNNHLEVVLVLLDDDKINVNAETEYKFTSLHFAAKLGYMRIVEALLKKQASVNAKDKGKFTPLHLAAQKNHTKIVNELLKKDEIDVNVQTTHGNTPLHLAAESGNLEIVKDLFARNANFDVKNKDRNTALDLAHEKNHYEVEDYIIQSQDKELKYNKRPETFGINHRSDFKYNYRCHFYSKGQ